MRALEERYLERLSELYPTIAMASTEIINLRAILSLPKGTEHFLTDIHGEYEAFAHVLKNGSGAVKRKIEEAFGNTMSCRGKQSLATLIYYPRERMNKIKTQEDNMEDWYRLTLYQLIQVCKCAASKYSRSKVRKALPPEFSYVIEELMTEKEDAVDKESYYNSIIKTIIDTGRAEVFIIALGELIQRLTVDHLHIVGDIYDRGPGPHIIMDKLMAHHSVDIQWGNHDVLWMGAAAGQEGCIANVIRICAKYNHLDILEEGYGINLLPLATFALNAYKDDPCECFKVKGENGFTDTEQSLNRKMHKAITIMQFKVEAQTIQKNPGFHMENRNFLHRIDYEKGMLKMESGEFELLDKNFPTVDPRKPYALTKEEALVMSRLVHGFMSCEKLQKHMRFLLNKGGLYKVYNGNLLYHGCVPLKPDGTLKPVRIFGKSYKGKALYEVLESYVRQGFHSLNEKERQRGKDIMWYVWLNENSPLFGKDKMATFERYFLREKETHKEVKNSYYRHLEDETSVDNIMREFGIEVENGHIINGHVPVKSKSGESPVKCGGKVLVIDGGFSRAYQKETGIAGYTLIYNSHGLILAAHEPFESTEAAIDKGSDIHSDSIVVNRVMKRQMVADTDIGRMLGEQVMDLEMLLKAYRSGRIAERL